MIGRMLLVVDIGNSNVTLGLVRAGVLGATRRAVTPARVTTDELELLIDGLLRLDDAAFADVSAISCASVVPALTGAMQAIATRRDRPLVVADAGTVPIAIRVDRPSDAGADRLVNALAAQRLYGTPAVVVDFGTATTFDCVAGDGAYVGGAIAPGLELGLEALASRTARLPRVDLAVPSRAIARDTVGAIQSGIFFGYASMVDGLVRRIREENGVEARVLATGGFATLLGPTSETIEEVDEFLTLDGLRILYERNR